MIGDDLNSIIRVGNVLRSKTCLTILKCLTQEDLSNQDIFDKIKDKIEIIHRSSIFEALKRIKRAGLIDKYYDNDTKKIKYKLKINSLHLNFDTLKITTENNTKNHGAKSK